MLAIDRLGPVTVLTLDRPGARNALTGPLVAALADALAAADADPEVHALVLTGRDPAFCAGLDLADLPATYAEIVSAGRRTGGARRGLLPRTATPVVGAVNGPAITGGLELALGCDLLVASDRATFADTHARVGVLPGGGMTVRLPQLVGVNRARQLSLTGTFIDAPTACAWGLVNEVVPHADLLARALDLAGAMAECDPALVAELRSMYDALGHRGDDEDYAEEARRSVRWMRERFDADGFADRRRKIIERGASQQ